MCVPTVHLLAPLPTPPNTKISTNPKIQLLKEALCRSSKRGTSQAPRESHYTNKQCLTKCTNSSSIARSTALQNS